MKLVNFQQQQYFFAMMMIAGCLTQAMQLAFLSLDGNHGYIIGLTPWCVMPRTNW
ncbi:hypothetical protein FACS189418_1770 [Clostridia bacterium]|nr:hypothetical protein FACS189418_1770 [Clostridia bacterium]